MSDENQIAMLEPKKENKYVTVAVGFCFLILLMIAACFAVLSYHNTEEILSNMTVNETAIYQTGYYRATSDIEQGIIYQLGKYGNVTMLMPDNQTITLVPVRGEK